MATNANQAAKRDAAKTKKPKITSRCQVIGPGSGIRGSSRCRMITMLVLEDGRTMSMAEYRALGKEGAK